MTNDGAALPTTVRATVGAVLVVAGLLLLWRSASFGSWLRRRAEAAAEGLGDIWLFRPSGSGQFPLVLLFAALVVALGVAALASGLG